MRPTPVATLRAEEGHPRKPRHLHPANHCYAQLNHWGEDVASTLGDSRSSARSFRRLGLLRARSRSGAARPPTTALGTRASTALVLPERTGELRRSLEPANSQYCDLSRPARRLQCDLCYSPNGSPPVRERLDLLPSELELRESDSNSGGVRVHQSLGDRKRMFDRPSAPPHRLAVPSTSAPAPPSSPSPPA
jgi:hypothetical protein